MYQFPNKTLRQAGLVTILLLLPGTLLAAGNNLVESLQMPAWYDRDNASQPLRPGDILKSGDVIRTGSDSRVLVKMAEGSVVKLGADTRFVISNVSQDPQSGNVFEAALKVVRGAFRFTTTELGKLNQRKIDVAIGSVTIGIRGTDIWGSSIDGEDLFALLSGNVSVQRDNEPAFNMQTPSTYITAKPGEPTAPIKTADNAMINTLARQTELQDGDGIVSVNGQWGVNLVSLRSDAASRHLLDQLHQAGYGANAESVDLNGQPWTRVRITGFVSQKDAESFATKISNTFGIGRPWILKPGKGN